MTYEYELWINGKIRRRTANQFKPNVVMVAMEDLLKLDPKQENFVIRITKLKSWKDKGPEIQFFPDLD